MDITSNKPGYTLYDAVSEGLALNQISIKKYLPSYLIGGKQAYRKIFWNTLYVTSNVWKTIKAGDPYPYVDVPQDAQRILYIGRQDHCGNVKPLFYNTKMNVIPKPKRKKCGCESCQCGGVCDDLNSVQFTTNVLFTINGQDYVEKIWIKTARNGDVIEYKEVPTKQYNDFVGDAGDFNNDYNNDFSGTGAGMGNFTIVTQNFQRKICSLEVLPCGCPKDNAENEDKVRKFCSCFMPFFGHRRIEHCDKFLDDPDYDGFGEVKLSECGTKIYFKPPSRHHHHSHHEKRIPDFLLIGYQTNGDPSIVTNQIQIPEYSKDAVWAGMFYYQKKFNPKYTKTERDDAKYLFRAECDDLLTYISPLSFEDISAIQDAKILW